MDLICAVHVLGNSKGERIGLVKFYESGYYPSDLDRKSWDKEQVDEFIKLYNERLGIPADVAESAFAGSMFGWHVPAAQQAIEFYKAKSVAS